MLKAEFVTLVSLKSAVGFTWMLVGRGGLVRPGVRVMVSSSSSARVMWMRVVVAAAVVGLVVSSAAVVVRRLGGRVAVPAPAVDGLVVVARAQVLVEDGPVRAVEGVLLAVGVAEVVDLVEKSNY